MNKDQQRKEKKAEDLGSHAAEVRRGEDRSFVIGISIIAAMAGLLFGYDTGVISGALLFLKKDFALGTGMQEIVTSIVLVGAVIGAASGGWMTDKFGRRKSIFIIAILFVGGAIWTSLAPTVGWLIIGRFIVGFAIGVGSFTGPLYISEVAPPSVRGSLVSINQLMITFGILVSYGVDFALAGGGAWRWMFALAAIPGFILAVGMLFLPTSARWLVRMNRKEEARKVLQRVRKVQDVQKELDQISELEKLQRESKGVLREKWVRPALVVGIGLAIFQQITGINTIIYYGPTIFQFAGIASASSDIFAELIVGAVNFLMTIVALILIDRVGRRPLLLWGLVGMTISLIVLGLAFLYSGTGNTLGYVAIACLIVYIGSFAVGLGPVFWLLISEIYPLRVRGRASGIATIFNWGFNLLVTLTFLSLTQWIGRPETFWVYAFFGVVTWFFVYFLVPETKGHTLEDIEKFWRSEKPAREM